MTYTPPFTHTSPHAHTVERPLTKGDVRANMLVARSQGLCALELADDTFNSSDSALRLLSQQLLRHRSTARHT